MNTPPLSDRMKDQYENRTRHYLMRRCPTIIRIDGKAFHTFTAKMQKPFDDDLIICMNNTAKELCAHIQGAQFAYIQSDEISILISDYQKIDTNAWFDYNTQKVVSVSASIATAYFNINATNRFNIEEPALFDSRVFQIADPDEVENYFIWRQQDAIRNSIQAVAQSEFSHSELHGKNQKEMLQMLYDQKYLTWSTMHPKYRHGRIIRKEKSLPLADDFNDRESQWKIDEQVPLFTTSRYYLRELCTKLTMNN